MRISKMVALAAPNVWSRNPVLEVFLASEPGQTDGAETWRDSCRRLCDAWSAESIESTANGDDERERLRNAAHPVEAFLDLVFKFQSLAGTAVDWGRVDIEASGLSALTAVEFVEEPVARMAVEMAHSLVWGQEGSSPPDLAPLLTRLRDCAEQTCFGATTSAVVAAARDRGIPVSRVDGDCLLQLGHGARQRRVQGAITDQAGYLAEAVSRDKWLTKQILQQICLPTADGWLVRNADEAWSAACDLGLPVVVKPRDSDYGNGVSISLTTREQVASAWERARTFRPEVLIERHLAGRSHRLFVAANSVVAAVRREPAHVVGDGKRSVSELIAEANRDPRRGEGPECPLFPIRADGKVVEVLAQQGLTMASVPAVDRVVSLQLDPSSCRAEEIVDVTDRVHAGVAGAVVDSVRAVGLDVAGVDVMAVDIGRPLEEQGGGILEVNAGPAIYLHRRPFCRPQRPVAEAIVESLFEAGDRGRIPIITITGSDCGGPLAQAIARLVDDGTRTIGVADSAGIAIGGRPATGGPSADLAGCRTLLAHPRIDVAICELPWASLRKEGLAFDECVAAVVCGFDKAIATDGQPADRARCLRLLAESVAPGGALVANLDDPDVEGQLTPGQSHLLAVSAEPKHEFLAAHRAAGGLTATLFDGGAVLAKGQRVIARLPFAAIGGKDSLAPPPTRVMALLACGAAWAIEEAARGTSVNYRIVQPLRVSTSASGHQLRGE
jgi:cyanophycin synthetase